MSGLRNFDDTLLPNSVLSTFAFCPRRYYLLNIEYNSKYYGNEFTEEGKLSHDNVHASKIERRKTLVKVNNMQIYSKILHLIGYCDTVEFYQNSTASYIPFLKNNYDIVVVEHKRNELCFNDCDIIQLNSVFKLEIDNRNLIV